MKQSCVGNDWKLWKTIWNQKKRLQLRNLLEAHNDFNEHRRTIIFCASFFPLTRFLCDHEQGKRISYCDASSTFTSRARRYNERKKRRKEKETAFHVITKTNSIFYQHFFSVHLRSLVAAAPDEQNIPVKVIVAVAGKNLTLPCPGVNEHSLIDTLTWKNTQTIAKYVNGMPMVQHQRVSNWNRRPAPPGMWKIGFCRLACYQIIIVYISTRHSRRIRASIAAR